jgi:MFS superfamily sulfate permease-like transporter
MRILSAFFPFLNWFRHYRTAFLRLDLISGITVALVLIPQSMAYAQLAGLPPYYGLYAAFLPPMLAALFGSSRQLATGPVAVVSLMTATALEPLATAGSEMFIVYAVLLALLVGAFQFTLGVLRLGIVVNFLSHPVVNGFTNAAAIIIATSQLSKVFGVTVDSAAHHYETVYNVIKAAVHGTHWPTLGMAALAFAVMITLKRLKPRIPNVLVAVIITTLLSYATGFNKIRESGIDSIADPAAQTLIQDFNGALAAQERLAAENIALREQLDKAVKDNGKRSMAAAKLEGTLALLDLQMDEIKEKIRELRGRIRGLSFESAREAGGPLKFYRQGARPAGMEPEGPVWKIKIANKLLPATDLVFMGGGAVVGVIPRGLPGMSLVRFDFSILLTLFPMAIIISLLGFMEAISIAKAMAAKSGQRLDPNQELIGQGVANILGSMGQSYPVSGSFSRSAVNFQSGAVTGLSSVFSSMVVAVTLLFFTPLLYHLPQAVLAAIIMMAVIGLINVSGFVHAWRAQRHDGVISVVTFLCTLGFAPHLDRGIIIGVLLSIGVSLFLDMKPRISLLSKYGDGSFRSTARFGLEQCSHIAVVRFHGSLFFASVNYLEERILEQIEKQPNLKCILLVCDGINHLDASGEDMLSTIVTRLRFAEKDIYFCAFNDSVLDVLRRTHLYEKIGEDNIFLNVSLALEAIHGNAHLNSKEKKCPLQEVCYTDKG